MHGAKKSLHPWLASGLMVAAGAPFRDRAKTVITHRPAKRGALHENRWLIVRGAKEAARIYRSRVPCARERHPPSVNLGRVRTCRDRNDRVTRRRRAANDVGTDCRGRGHDGLFRWRPAAALGAGAVFLRRLPVCWAGRYCWFRLRPGGEPSRFAALGWPWTCAEPSPEPRGSPVSFANHVGQRPSPRSP